MNVAARVCRSPDSWPWTDHAQISLIHSPTPPKCSTRAIVALINNLGIVYHQYCSSSYLDYCRRYRPDLPLSAMEIKFELDTDKANAADFIYIIDQMESVTDNMFKHFQQYNSFQFLILVLGLTGVILMYRGKKLGFHFYILYSLGLVVLPYFFNPITGIPTILTIVGIIYGGVWVWLYSRNLNWLKD